MRLDASPGSEYFFIFNNLNFDFSIDFRGIRIEYLAHRVNPPRDCGVQTFYRGRCDFSATSVFLRSGRVSHAFFREELRHEIDRQCVADHRPSLRGLRSPLGVSIRPGWFWHAAEDTQVKTGEDLLTLYLKSTGRNSKLLLNVPPTRVGVFDRTDVRSLGDFARLRESLLAVNRLEGAPVRASGAAPGHAPSAVLDGNPDTYWTPAPHERRGWLAFETSKPVEFDTLRLAEAIALGQQIAGYRLECRTPAGVWRTVTWGTTIGCQKIDRFAPVTARELRLGIEFAYGPPRLAAVGLYRSAES